MLITILSILSILSIRCIDRCTHSQYLFEAGHDDRAESLLQMQCLRKKIRQQKCCGYKRSSSAVQNPFCCSAKKVKSKLKTDAKINVSGCLVLKRGADKGCVKVEVECFA